MAGQHFISYSRADANEFALKFADALSAGPPSLPVWLDVRELKPGQPWDEQIGSAVEGAKTILFIMTEDSVETRSECKSEWTRAIRLNKPVVPILLDPDVELPFRLANRQYIDFTDQFDAALAQLRQHLQWLDSTDGKLHSLNDRLADAKRDARRASTDAHRDRNDRKIEQIELEIERLKTARDEISDPEPTAEPELPSKGTSVPPATEPAKDNDESIEEQVLDNQDVYAFDTDDPPPDIWFNRLRPVLHQASHYSVPTYYLDHNLKVIDWNVAFELVFSDLVASIRYKHVNWFIVRLANCDQVFEHARRFTETVRRGQLPLVDIEPLRYSSSTYGNILFEKVASPLHDRNGKICGWTVALMIREIEWAQFLRDLKQKLWQDKLWSLYSTSYDPVLREFPPYHALIKDVISVVPARSSHVADLGAGSGNVTSALVEAGHRVTSVELSLSMLDWLRAKGFDPKSVSIVKASVDQLEALGEGKFDAATMVNVLYAVDDPYAVLKEVHSILKPGGVFGYSTTYADVRLGPLLDSIQSELKSKGKWNQLADHYENLREANEAIEGSIARRFTRDEYVEWTEAAGFELLREPWDTYEGAVMVVHARKR